VVGQSSAEAVECSREARRVAARGVSHHYRRRMEHQRARRRAARPVDGSGRRSRLGRSAAVRHLP